MHVMDVDDVGLTSLDLCEGECCCLYSPRQHEMDIALQSSVSNSRPFRLVIVPRTWIFVKGKVAIFVARVSVMIAQP